MSRERGQAGEKPSVRRRVLVKDGSQTLKETSVERGVYFGVAFRGRTLLRLEEGLLSSRLNEGVSVGGVWQSWGSPFLGKERFDEDHGPATAGTAR